LRSSITPNFAALINNSELRIDMDNTASSGSIDAITFAGIIMRDFLSGWGSGTLTVYSTTNSNYTTGTTLRGSLGFSGMFTNILFIPFASTTDRYWKLSFSSLTAPIEVAMICIGKYYDLARRWEYTGSSEGRRAFNLSDELPGGRVVSRNARSEVFRRFQRTYQFLDETHIGIVDSIISDALGTHTPVVITDDGQWEGALGRVVRLSQDAFDWEFVQYQLYHLTIAFQEVPRVPDGKVY
jgi:hypothetical protein